MATDETPLSVRPWTADRTPTELQHPLFNRLHGQALQEYPAFIVEALKPLADEAERRLDVIEKIAARPFPDLRPEARQRRITELSKAPAAELREVARGAMAERRRAVEAHRRLLTAATEAPAVDATATLVRALRHQEVRAEMRKMTDPDRAAFIRRQALDGRLDALWAAQASPIPLADDDELRQLAEEVAVTRHPWLISMGRDTREAQAQTANLVGSIYTELRRLLQRAGVGGPDERLEIWAAESVAA